MKVSFPYTEKETVGEDRPPDRYVDLIANMHKDEWHLFRDYMSFLYEINDFFITPLIFSGSMI